MTKRMRFIGLTAGVCSVVGVTAVVALQPSGAAEERVVLSVAADEVAEFDAPFDPLPVAVRELSDGRRLAMSAEEEAHLLHVRDVALQEAEATGQSSKQATEDVDYALSGRVVMRTDQAFLQLKRQGATKAGGATIDIYLVRDDPDALMPPYCAALVPGAARARAANDAIGLVQGELRAAGAPPDKTSVACARPEPGAPYAMVLVTHDMDLLGKAVLDVTVRR